MSARLFVALDLPPAVRADLTAFGHAAAAGDGALRALDEQALHLTLAFLGHRALDEVDPAREAVRRVAVGAPALGLGEALWLAPRRPHVLSVALEDGDGTLAELRADVVERVAAALPAWAPETRPFRPHVTVARVRRGARPRTRALPEAPHARFVADAVALYRSHLGAGSPRYEALERVALSRTSCASGRRGPP